MDSDIQHLLDELQIEIHIADSQLQLTFNRGLTKRRLLNILDTLGKAYDITEELLKEVSNGISIDTSH